jgi:hypothetical protein
LNSIGVFTIHDLLHSTSDVHSATLVKFKQIARPLVSGSDTPSVPAAEPEYSHTWGGQIGYIYRSSGSIQRVVVGKLRAGLHRLVVQVRWKEAAEYRQKGVSPFQLVHNQFSWLSSDIVSEDSDGDQTTHLTNCLPRFECTDPVAVPHREDLNNLVWEVQKVQFYTSNNLERVFTAVPTRPSVRAVVANHSWSGLSVYTIRYNQIVSRGVIGPLLITPYRLVVYVYWRTRTRVYRTSCDPISLLYQQNMWYNNDLVSDSDTDTVPYGPPYQKLTAWDFTLTDTDAGYQPAVTLLQTELNRIRAFLE